MSSDEKKVVKLDEEKGEQKSIKPNEKEEEIGLLSKPMLMSKSRQTQKYFHRKRPLLAPLLALEVLISALLICSFVGSVQIVSCSY